ncbi:MAG: hypothetical protein EA424_05635 [Planctomycetaceae bacterium]|nr:MAG: hypothetical protein EA424_05635 [Planctomycetaceae bacterium]
MMMKPTLTRRQWMLGSGAATAAGLLQPRALADTSGSSGIRAGAAVADITLPLGASNLGVISRNPPPTHIHDPLYARCLALGDGTTQLAFAICDLRMIDRERSEAARRALAEAVALPPAHILISATHSFDLAALCGHDVQWGQRRRQQHRLSAPAAVLSAVPADAGRIPRNRAGQAAGVADRRSGDRRGSLRGVRGDRIGDQGGEPVAAEHRHRIGQRLHWLPADAAATRVGWLRNEATNV